MKNEGPFLLEWLSFHRALGFTDAMVFTNDCEDGSDAMADHLAAQDWFTHIRNEPGKRGPQWTALNSPELRKALRTAEFAMHLDSDEFLNVKAGDGSLDALIGAMGNADAISIPWRFFGNAGVMELHDTPVLEQFTRCGPYPIMFPRQALMFKTLFRPSDRLDRAGVHAPRLAKDASLSDLIWLNGSGKPVSPRFDPKNPIMHGPDFGNDLAQINHYALRSMTSFLVKSDRGLPNHGHVPVDLNYWAKRNFNDQEDLRLADRDHGHDDLSDETLLDLHDKAFDWHQAKALEILATPKGAEFFSALAVTGDTKVPPDEQIGQIYTHFRKVFGKAAQQS